MMIDGGAEGIVAPYVETKAQVETLIGAVRYRPIKGELLRQIIYRERKPEEKLIKFWDDFNANTYLIIGIESVPAIENLEKLLDYDEVDGVFLGPHDITSSMEIPEEYANPKFLDAMKHVIKTCKSMGKGVGLHRDFSKDVNRKMIDEGMNFILHDSDVMKSVAIIKHDFSEIREMYGDVYNKSGSADQQDMGNLGCQKSQ